MIRVDQYVETLRARDAVGDEARLFRDRLRSRGFDARIVAATVEPAAAHDVHPYDPTRLRDAEAVVYHHATGGRWLAALARRRSPTALLYHGTTPPELLRPDEPLLAATVEDGRAALARFARRFPVRLADSRFGAGELRAIASVDAAVLPFCLDERRFSPALPRRRTGISRWLSVGRIAPNKNLPALVAAFARFRTNVPDAVLTIAGEAPPTSPAVWAVRRAIRAHGLQAAVRITGSLDDAALDACFRDADVYVGTSRHEGFYVPLIEAMRAGLPIVAVARAAVPETLGHAGVLVTGDDPDAFASAVLRLADDARRDAVVAVGHARFAELRPERTLAAFDGVIDRLIRPSRP